MNNCKYCGKEAKNKKFCSRSCSAKINNIGVRRHGNDNAICEWCGKEIKPQNKYCSAQCLKNFQYFSYINIWMIGLETGAKLNGFTPSKYVRRYLKKYLQ